MVIFFCLIALARSRDAYGHGRLAVLGFIPIANFWLLLTPSENETSTNRLATPPLLSGGLGVFTGLVLFAAAFGVTAYIEFKARTMEQQSQTEPIAQFEWIDSMIRAQGLEETLRLMAAEAQTPVAIDEVTTLSRIEATATQLQRTYVIELDDMVVTDEFRNLIRTSICEWQPFEPILRARGSILEVYVDPGGRLIGTATVTRNDCGY